FGDWLTSRAPDILLLQETRAPVEVVHGFFPEWHVAVHPSQEKGRAGVAIVSRFPIEKFRTGLPTVDAVNETPRDSGRWIEAEITGPASHRLTVVSTYFHSATNTPELAHTMTAKYAHLDQVEQRLAELVGAKHPVIVGGDLNIAHRNQDLANWKGNLKSAGFLPEERAYFDRWFGNPDHVPAQPTLGWTDLGRHHAGDVAGPYTWWTWRGQAFTNDRGWRLDYHLGNPAATRVTRGVVVDKQPSYEERYSDHAPVIARLEFAEI
ncbi:MAG: exodeoxyribonuclease III, partial [Promicromonosporaceae bacterium]|nr:exodeoxyribonuclease III [Promicromonosporaceae bacterium]